MLINKAILAVDIADETWNHLHNWVFEASEAILGLKHLEPALRSVNSGPSA